MPRRNNHSINPITRTRVPSSQLASSCIHGSNPSAALATKRRKLATNVNIGGVEDHGPDNSGSVWIPILDGTRDGIYSGKTIPCQSIHISERATEIKRVSRQNHGIHAATTCSW